MTSYLLKLSKVIIVALAMLPAGVCSGMIIYTDAGTWSSAVTGGTTFNYEGIAPGLGYATTPVIPGLTVTISPIQSYYVVSSSFASGADSLNGTDSLQGGINFDTSITLQFGSAVTAFGTLIGYTNDTPSPPAAAFSAALYNGVVQVGSTYTSPSLNSGFIGFTSTGEPFDRVQFVNLTASSPYLTFDNTRFATATVPEPSCMVLLGAGSGVLLLQRNRARREAR